MNSAQPSERVAGAALSADNPPASLPLLLDDRQAATLLGVSMQCFDSIKNESYFPAPIVLGPRLRKYVASEIAAVPANMPRGPKGASTEPAELLRARIERAKRSGDLSPASNGAEAAR